jgi:hypothetical protein
MTRIGALACVTGSFAGACRRWLAGRPTQAWPALALALGLAAAPLPADAQARTGLPRIGILSFDAAPSGTGADLSQGWRRGLAEHGYVEGQNILVEWRYAAGRSERLATLAAELVQLKVDVILALGPGPREAARRATRSIPLVTTSGADPVAEGWAQTLARPGGNVTGLTVTYPRHVAPCRAATRPHPEGRGGGDDADRTARPLPLRHQRAHRRGAGPESATGLAGAG